MFTSALYRDAATETDKKNGKLDIDDSPDLFIIYA